MIIKQYGGLPTTYAPDIGEVVEARWSGQYSFARAAVTSVSRRRGGVLRIGFVWLETNDQSTAVIGQKGHVYCDPDGPPLVRQINGGTPPAP